MQPVITRAALLPLEVKKRTYKCLTHLAKIHSQPDLHAPVVQVIAQGTRLSVVAEQGDWLKLYLQDGVFGWIRYSLVQETK